MHAAKSAMSPLHPTGKIAARAERQSREPAIGNQAMLRRSPQSSAPGIMDAGHEPAPAHVERALASTGQPIAPAAQMLLAPGLDLSHVRLHTGAVATDSAAALGAAAYTRGSDIVMRSGREQLRDGADWSLLTHELTHVKQNAHDPSAGPRRLMGHDDDSAEREARNSPAVLSRDTNWTTATAAHSDGAQIRLAPETWYRGEGGVPPARPGGVVHDLGDGVYFTDIESVADIYAGRREGADPAKQGVFKVVMETSEFGRVVDLTTDPKWKQFISMKAGDGTLEDIIKRLPVMYGNTVKQYLKNQGVGPDDVDAIIGYEYINGGKQMCVKPSIEPKVRAAMKQIKAGPAGSGPGGGGETPAGGGSGSKPAPEEKPAAPAGTEGKAPEAPASPPATAPKAAEPEKPSATPKAPEPEKPAGAPKAAEPEKPAATPKASQPEKPVGGTKAPAAAEEAPAPKTPAVAEQPAGGGTGPTAETEGKAPPTAPGATIAEDAAKKAASASNTSLGMGIFHLALLAFGMLSDPAEELAIKQGMQSALQSASAKARFAELDKTVQAASGDIFYNIDFKVTFVYTTSPNPKSLPTQRSVKSIEVTNISVSANDISRAGEVDQPEKPASAQPRLGGGYYWEAHSTTTSSSPVRSGGQIAAERAAANRAQEQRAIADKLRALPQLKQAAPAQPEPAPAPAAPSLLPAPEPAAPVFLPGAPGPSPLDKAKAEVEQDRAVGDQLVARGNALMTRASGNAATADEKKSFVTDAKAWRLIVRSRQLWFDEHGPSVGSEGMKQLQLDDSRPGPKLARMVELIGDG